MIQKIPKILHYCWFGKNKKSDIIKKCIASWEKLLPDYQIIQWNEDNFDIDSSCNYVKKAYDAKKYAFCTDFIRLWALYHFGGIYVDADVKIVRPLDIFLQHRAFTGHETKDLTVAATMGAEPKHPWIKMLLDYYNFAELNEISNTQIITILSKPWIVERNEEENYTYLRDGVVIFPISFFASFDHQKLMIKYTDEAYTYHNFAGSWINGRLKV